MTKTIVQIGGQGKRRNRNEKSQAAAAASSGLGELDVRVELIRALVPIGLEAVEDTLQREVTKLAGERYQREGGQPGYARWGSQPGSVYLADQKVSVRVPRVRNLLREQEVPLGTYQALRSSVTKRVVGV